MSYRDSDDYSRLGENYLVDRWTTGATDEKGNLIWHDGAPSAEETKTVHMITVDLNPDGEPDYRNLAVSPDRPLDPLGADTSDFGPEPYDLDDLVETWRIISP